MADKVQQLNAGLAALNINSSKRSSAVQPELCDLLSKVQADLNFTIPPSSPQSGWKNPIDMESMSAFDPKSLSALSDNSNANASHQGYFASNYTTIASNKCFFTLSASFDGGPVDPVKHKA